MWIVEVGRSAMSDLQKAIDIVESLKCVNDDWDDCVGVNGEHCATLEQLIKALTNADL